MEKLLRLACLPNWIHWEIMLVQAVFYDQSENTIRFHFGTTNPASDNTANEKVRLIGQFYANTTFNTNGDFINGREFTVTCWFRNSRW